MSTQQITQVGRSFGPASNGEESVIGSANKYWTPSLLWKEVKQSLPLITMVLAGGILLTVLVLMFEAFGGKLTASNWDRGNWMMFVAIPIFFATGIGVLLVGNEKEHRTLQWLQTLPISSRAIAWNKIVAMVFALIFVWICAFLIWIVAGFCHGVWPFANLTPRVDGSASDVTLLWNYLLVSAFLAFGGLAYAWRFQSSLVALVMLVPSALLVWVLSYYLSDFVDNGSSFNRNIMETGTYRVLLLVGTVCFAIDGWRVSQRQLHAQGGSSGGVLVTWLPTAWGRSSSGRVTDAETIRERGIAALNREVVSPLAGMMWQTLVQNRWWWIVSFSFAAICTGLSAGIPRSLVGDYSWSISRFEEQIAPVLLYGVMVAICWLGVVSYQGDNIRERARFYSDRGVSPRWLWVTRHWIPLLLIVALTLLRTMARVGGKFPAEIQTSGALALDASLFLIAGLAVYSVGQWTSHWLNSPVIAIVIGTVCANAMLFYCLFASIPMEAPWWMLPIPFAFMFAATAWLMQDWMERRFDWKFKAKHAAFAILGMLIPLLPGLQKLASMPNISRLTYTELEELAKSTAPWGDEYVRRYLPMYEVSDTPLNVPSLYAMNAELRRKTRAEMVQSGWDAADVWALQSHGGIGLLVSELIALRGTLEMGDSVDSMAASETLRKQYQAMLTNCTKLVRELRGTEFLFLCDQAEELEIALLNECRHVGNRERMGELVYSQVVRLLGESDMRDRARKVALAAAYIEQGRQERTLVTVRSNAGIPYEFGGYPSYLLSDYGASEGYGSGPATFLATLRMRRASGVFTQDVWDLLKLEDRKQRHEARAAISNRLGSYGYANPSDVYGEVTQIGQEYVGVPCRLWRGDWENVARELGATLDVQPKKVSEVGNE
jgi:ABC-type transport system involved in multi-copper enzyme maturation permease subunit